MQVGSTPVKTAEQVTLVSTPGLCGPQDALVITFRFDRGSGTTALDDSTFGHDGTLLGGPTRVPGLADGGLRFDGVDDEVNVGSPDALDNLTTLTACAWVFPEGYPNQYPAIADKSQNTFIGGWNFFLEDDRSFGLLTNRRHWATGGTIDLNRWQHVCVSWDGSDGRAGIALYHEGVSVPRTNFGDNGNMNDSDASRDLIVGRVNNGTYPFQGVIDDFRLYGRVLSPSEVTSVRDCLAP